MFASGCIPVCKFLPVSDFDLFLCFGFRPSVHLSGYDPRRPTLAMVTAAILITDAQDDFNVANVGINVDFYATNVVSTFVNSRAFHSNKI